jgi:hypothetical protein
VVDVLCGVAGATDHGRSEHGSSSCGGRILMGGSVWSMGGGKGATQAARGACVLGVQAALQIQL